MKRYSLWLKLAMLVCALISVVSATHTSLAYMTASSNTLQNSFRVVYLPAQDISVPVVIRKTMINLSEEEVSPGGFGFRLSNVENGETTVATSSEDGWAAMHLTFTAEDAGKTYRYRLQEINAGRENVIYDDTVYDIGITLALNEINEISAQLTVNGERVNEIVVEYKNRYYVPALLPDTGDHAKVMLWLAMLVVSGVGLVVLRKNETIFRRLQ